MACSQFLHNERPTIRFSHHAWLILKDDHEKFSQGEPFSTFLQNLFQRYYKEAECNLLETSATQEGDFYHILEDLQEKNPGLKKIQDAISLFSELYLDFLKDSLVQKIPDIPEEDSYESYKLRLNTDCQKILEKLHNEEWDQDPSYHFYGKIEPLARKETPIEKKDRSQDKFVKTFLKAIFEEYARLPAYKREAVYFSVELEEIDKAINRHNVLKITTEPRYSKTQQKMVKRTFHVTPHKVLQDSTGLYNYLVGYAKEQGLPEDTTLESKTSSFRLSKIGSLDTLRQTNVLSKKEIDKIEKELTKKSVQFLTAEDIIKVIVRFNKAGKRDLKHHVHLRPLNRELIEETEEYARYSFECSFQQALYYFFKFGTHAYVEEPAELRHELMRRYLEDYEFYRDNEPHQPQPEGKKEED